MPNTEEQGTGKHPHKSTEEPYPHHEGKVGSAGAAGRRAVNTNQRRVRAATELKAENRTPPI